MLSIHLIIKGRVQGVAYRAWFSRNAKQHGLNGWVRNRTDGSVEAVISGHPIVCEEMILQAQKGSLAAKVTEIIQREADEVPADGFVIRDTV